MSSALPIHVVMNLASGGGDKDSARSAIDGALRSAGRLVTFHQIGDDEALRRVVAECDGDRGVVVAAGGDGTINTVAGALLGKRLVMGIVPLGTFNYVAKLLDIPPHPEAAAKVIVEGMPRTVHVGTVNDRVFLNNVGIGLYVRLIEQRERHTGMFGRNRLVAVISALATLLRGTPSYTMRIDVGGKARTIDAPLLFLCANSLQMENLNVDPAIVQAVNDGQIAAIVVKSATPGDIFVAAGHILAGTLADAEHVDVLCDDSIEITTARRSIRLVVDGEIVRLDLPLRIRAQRNALTVMAPRKVPAES